MAPIFKEVISILGTLNKNVSDLSFCSSKIFSYNPVINKNRGYPLEINMVKAVQNSLIFTLFTTSSIVISIRLFTFLAIFKSCLIAEVTSEYLCALFIDKPIPKIDKSIFASRIKGENNGSSYNPEASDNRRSLLLTFKIYNYPILIFSKLFTNSGH